MVNKAPEYNVKVISMNLGLVGSFLIGLAITVGFSTMGLVAKRLVREGMKKCQTQ